MDTWIISGVFIFLLAYAAIYYWFKCRKRILAINDEVEQVLDTQDIAAALTESESLAPVWRGFEQTLTKTPERAYSTTDAAEFFSVQALTQGFEYDVLAELRRDFYGLRDFRNVRGLDLWT